MPNFQLFRIKVIRLSQVPLPFTQQGAPGDILRRTINARPAADLREGYTWHIGNVEQLDPDALYFALGRTTHSNMEFFDETTQNFIEARVPNAPYTHVVCDLGIQVCAIASKPKLAPTAAGIARQLERLLNEHVPTNEGVEKFSLTSLEDPHDFLDQLTRAYQIKQFSVEFSRPNPFDADRDFQRPMQALLHNADGLGGRTTISGHNLATEPLQQLTRAAAATGDNAEALLRLSVEGPFVKRRLRGNAVTLSQDEEEDLKRMKGGVLYQVREVYQRIRHGFGALL